jgi:hypothetical protein
LHAQQAVATRNATVQQELLHVAHPRECNTQQRAELTRLMQGYAERHAFTKADLDEALQVATAGDVDGWIAYLQSQNATKH